MIHGNRVSIGCIAMGDEVAENLFVLAADTGIQNISVILSPIDFRRVSLPESKLVKSEAWILNLYQTIEQKLGKLKRTTSI